MTPRKPDASRRKLKNVALFTQEDENQHRANLISIDHIKLSPQQPRHYFDSDKLEGLVLSIKQHGILEPLIVRPLGASQYELVAGERRLRAAKSLDFAEVPVIIREMNDEDALAVALIENLQREDLNAIEETEGILNLLCLTLNMELSEVSALLYRMLDESKGKVPHNVMGSDVVQDLERVFSDLGLMAWPSFVSNRLPLLNLPTEVLLAIREGKIEYTKAQIIARIKDTRKRKRLLKEAINSCWSLAIIKQKVLEISKPPEKANSVDGEYRQRLENVYRQVRKAKIWSVPHKQKKLDKALSTIESLLED